MFRFKSELQVPKRVLYCNGLTIWGILLLEDDIFISRSWVQGRPYVVLMGHGVMTWRACKLGSTVDAKNCYNNKELNCMRNQILSGT